MNRFCKAMSHLNSTQIDEKIKFLDKQLKKTGIVLEAGPTMGTGNIYQTFRYDFTSELPEIEEYVPDSTGFTTGNSTQDANGGDESDSDTWENGWNNTNDMKNSNNLNGETNRIIPYTPDFSGWDGSGVSANNRGSGGYASIGIWTISSGLGGGKSIGTIDSTNHFIQILIPDNIFSSYNYPADQSGPLAGGYYGSYTDPEFAVAQSVAETYEDHKTASLWVSRKVWVNYDQATESDGPSYADYTGAKKQTTNASNGQPLYWKLKSVSVLAGARQNYISQTKRLESSTTTLLTQRSLDDPSVYPGNPNKFMDFLRGALDVGEKAFDWLADKAGEVRDTVQDTLDQFMDELEGNESNLPPKVKDFIQDTKDSSLTQSIIDNVLEPFREKMAEKRIIPAAQNVVNYLTDNLPDNLDNDYLNSLEDGYVDKVIANGNLQDDGTFYAGENIVGTAQVPREDGDYVEIDFNMGFKSNIQDFADRAADPLYGEVNPILQALYDMLGPYSFDAQTSTGVPLIDMAAGYIFSELIEKAKLYGGAQDKPGTLRISKEKLKELNPTMYYGLSGDWTGDQSSTPSMDGTQVAGAYSGMYDIDGRGWFVTGDQLNRMKANPERFNLSPAEIKMIQRLKVKKDNKQTTQVAHYEPQGKLITEGWESPKYTYVDKDQQKRWFKEKDVAPVYPKKAPPKMVKGWHPKFVVKLEKPIPVIKVSKKDLERSHAFKPDEVEELMQLVKNLNDYIKRNPDHLAYARVRYPKHDPRLAALNYKLDMQLAAADEYIETRFPENERLFDRLMRRTKESIKLTDPKTYDNNNGKLITFNKLARIGNDYQPRKIKLKKKPKISQGKLFLLPDRKKKDDILKDKMAVLDKEIQKTMPEA